MEDVLNWLAERADYIVGTAAIGLGAASLSKQVDEVDTEETQPDARTAAAGLAASVVATGAATILTDWASLQGVALGLAMFFGGRLVRALKDRSWKEAFGFSDEKPEAKPTEAKAEAEVPAEAEPEAPVAEPEVVVIHATSTVSEVDADGNVGKAEKIGTQSTVSVGKKK